MPPDPRRFLFRLPGPGLCVRPVRLATWVLLGALEACGGPPRARPESPRPEAGATASDSRTTSLGVLLDVTSRPGSNLAALVLAWPVPVGERAPIRALLARRAEALRVHLAPLGAEAATATLAGVPALIVSAPDARLAELLPALAAGLEEALPATPPAVTPLLPGDTLDALGVGMQGGGPAPGHPAVLMVHGRERLVAPDSAGALELDGVLAAWARMTAAQALPSAPIASPGPVVVLRRGAGPARLALSYPIASDATSGAAELLRAILAGGDESRLARALGPAGLERAQVSGELRRGASGERMVLSVELPPEDVDTGWHLVDRVIDELTVSPITSVELARARAWLADHLAFERATATALAHRRAVQLLRHDGPLPPEAEFDRAVDMLSAAHVQHLAAALGDADPTGLVVTPAADAEVDDALWAESLAEMSRRGRPAGASAPERRPGVFEVTDALQLVTHTRRADTVVAFELRISGGVLAEPPELPGVAALAVALMARPLESAPFPLQGRVARDHLVLSVRAPAERWTDALELLARRVSRWPQRAETLEDARQRTLQSRAAQQSDPRRLARALVEQGLGDSTLTRDLFGTAEGLSERTGVEVRNFLDGRVSGQRMTLVVVGRIEPGRLIPAVRAAFGPLARATMLASPLAAPRPARFERRVDGELACAAVGYPLPTLRGREFAAVEVLAALVAPARISRCGTRAALLVERCGQDAQAALVEIVTSVERVALTGSVPGELDAVRARLMGQLARTADSPEAMATWLADAESLHSPFTGPDAVEHWRDALLAVDAPLLRSIAHGLPPLHAAVSALVGPTSASVGPGERAPEKRKADVPAASDQTPGGTP